MARRVAPLLSLIRAVAVAGPARWCGRLRSVHARSALFDLYGDHLRRRGGEAPVAVLVRLLAPLGVTAPAVRTAISRMVRQDWLRPVRLEAGPGYALTDRAGERLDEAASRIYRTRTPRWSGAWDLLVLDPVRGRSTRERVRSALGYLGYAPLSDTTWISPAVSPEVARTLANEGVGFARFSAHDDAPAAQAARAWDLDALAETYRAWHRFAADLLESPEQHLDPAATAPVTEDEQAFAVRSLLVHEWRKFLFTDPGLPAELLPAGWAGHEAARFFDEQAGRLMPAAARFVDACLTDPAGTSGRSDTDTTTRTGAA